MKAQIKSSVIILSALFLSSCSNMLGSSIKTQYIQPISKFSSSPELNILSTAELGEAMLKVGQLKTFEGIKLTAPIEHIYNNGNYKITIPAGLLKAIKKGASEQFQASFTNKQIGGVFYESAAGIEWHNIPADVSIKIPGGVIISDNNKINKALYYEKNYAAYAVPINDIFFKKEIIEEWEPNTFAQELIYNGLSSDNKVKFIYREFDGGMIRDKFTQEVSYDLTKGDVIGFKGSRFKIIKATNIEIQYEVLKGFTQ